MQSVRVTAAGAVVVASLSFLTAPAGACDDRYVKKCEREAAARVVQEDAAPTAQRKSMKRGKGFASRRAQRMRLAKRMGPPRFAIKRDAALAGGGARMTALLPESALARRFRGFIDPRSMAENAFEVLRKPHLVALDFDAAAIVPPAVGGPGQPQEVASAAAPASVVTTTPKQDRVLARAAPTMELASAESKPVTLPPLPPVKAAATPIQAAAAAPVAAVAETILTEAPLPVPADQQPSRFSIHQLVLALCGALGAASALRFIVGA